MRIIGGDLKGKKLFSVEGTRTRPTADRLRESIFNILSFHVRESTVLDLFSGTGALGLEALSRGAAKAVFIDFYKKAVVIIERNIKACCLEDRSKIIKWDVTRNLNCLRGYRPAFNLVLMDPPYGRNTISPTLENLHRSGCLDAGARIVIEHTSDEPTGEYLAAYTLYDRRVYGKTLVSFFSYVV